MPWPPTAQTVMKRLGNGYWEQALRNIGDSHQMSAAVSVGYSDSLRMITITLSWTSSRRQTRPDRAPTFDAYREWVESEDRAGRRRPSDASVRLRYTSWNNAKRLVAASGARTPASIHTRQRTVTGSSPASTLALHRAQDELRRFLGELKRRLLHLKSRRWLKSSLRTTGRNLNTRRREWLRNIIEIDPEAVERRLQQGGLSRSQRDAFEQDLPDIAGALSDIYLDRMLSGKSGGLRSTDSWLRSEAQAELDALPDDVVARVKVLHEVRNFLTHSSEEARNRLHAALAPTLRLKIAASPFAAVSLGAYCLTG